MFDPSQLTLGQVSSTIRDLSIVAVLIGTAWKARGLYEEGVAFFKRCTRHMDIMEVSMNMLLTNHLSHIEKDLAKLTGRNPEVK
jgi:hypothetical protein